MSLLRAEYRKLTRRKLYPVMLLILIFLLLMTAAVFFFVIPQIPEIAGDSPVPQKPGAYEFGALQVAGQAWWFAVILATAVLGGEVSGTSWATSLTRDSRKWAHIGSRLLIFGVAAWLAFLLGTLAWGAIVLVGAEGSGGPELSEWLGWAWRFSLVAGAWTSIGLAAVALTRSVGVSIGIALGFSFLDSIIAPFVGPYENVSLTAASNGLFGVGGDSPFSLFIPGSDMSLAQAVTVMAGWALVGLILTWWGFQRRDA
jgi:ABC-type transport system involved in multi-copper enzyme maturation permease subunit